MVHITLNGEPKDLAEALSVAQLVEQLGFDRGRVAVEVNQKWSVCGLFFGSVRLVGSTFDQVARAAGVSRGLLHYYFGTKERLFVEVVRRDFDVRLELLDAQLADARTADDFVAGLVASLAGLLRNCSPASPPLFELFTLSRRHEEIAAEFAELLRRQRERLAELLRAKEEAGVLRLRASPEAVVDVIFSLGDGVAMRMLAEPERDFSATVRAGILCVRALLDDPA